MRHPAVAYLHSINSFVRTDEGRPIAIKDRENLHSSASPGSTGEGENRCNLSIPGGIFDGQFCVAWEKVSWF